MVPQNFCFAFVFQTIPSSNCNFSRVFQMIPLLCEDKLPLIDALAQAGLVPALKQ
jgi:hypothetical protein